jgi:hypothetical protein
MVEYMAFRIWKWTANYSSVTADEADVMEKIIRYEFRRDKNQLSLLS